MKDVSLLASGGVVTRGAVSGFNSDGISGEPSNPSPVKELIVKSADQKPAVFQENAAKVAGAGMQTITATYTAKQTSGGATHGQPSTGGAVYEGGRSNPSNTVAYRDKNGQVKQR